MGLLDNINPTKEQDIEIFGEWIDKIPLTRPKVNLGWDFSDALMLAEVI